MDVKLKDADCGGGRRGLEGRWRSGDVCVWVWISGEVCVLDVCVCVCWVGVEVGTGQVANVSSTFSQLSEVCYSQGLIGCFLVPGKLLVCIAVVLQKEGISIVLSFVILCLFERF